MAVAIQAMIFVISHTVCGSESGNARHTREYFRHEMAATVRHDHPAILPLAAAVRAITTNPLEQLVVVNDVTHLLVDYDDDERVWGVEEYHATFDEMLARRREAGWVYLRDDGARTPAFAAFPYGEPIRAGAVPNTAHAAKAARPIILPRGKTAASSPASPESVTRGIPRS